MSGLEGILLSSFLQALFQSIFQAVPSIVSKFGKAAYQELEKWKSLLPEVAEGIESAVMLQQSNAAINRWVSDVKQLYCDAEDIIDDLKYESLRQQVEGRRLLSLSFLMFRSNSNPKELAKITSRLQHLTEEKGKLELSISSTWRASNECWVRTPTVSLEHETAIYGRDEEAKRIMEIIGQNESEASPVVIPIVGMAGIGKTTLGRRIYNHKELVARHKVWISVSGRIDIMKITKEIFDGIIKETASVSHSSMQERIKERLTNGTYIIVLDDVWSAIPDTWRGILLLFRGRKGTIIVTTRSEDVAELVGTRDFIRLPILSDKHCWHLFCNHSGLDPTERSTRSVIGKKMVIKCSGLPLAVATLGDIVRKKNRESEWEDVLKRKLWDLADEGSNMKSNLKRNYEAMDYKLKRCFAMCALVPDKYEFDENEIVSLWLGAGLIEWEEIKLYDGVLRHECFQELVSRSVFIQKQPEFPTSNELPRYTMHELFSDMASQVMGRSLCKLDQNSPFPLKWDGVRHFSCSTSNFRHILEQWPRRKDELSISTMFVWGSERVNSSLLGTMSSKLKYARVLSVPWVKDSEAYDWIDNLKHLRCVRVDEILKVKNRDSFAKLYQLEILKSRVRELPMGVTNLQGLRVLDVGGVEELPEEIRNLRGLLLLSLPSSEITELPSSIGGLCELAELCLEGCINLQRLPDEIGRLRCLKVLTLSASGITELPSCIVQSLPAGLAELRLYNCSNLLLSDEIRSLPFCGKPFRRA